MRPGFESENLSLTVAVVFIIAKNFKNFWLEINSQTQTRDSTKDFRDSGQVIFPGENEDFFNPVRMIHAGDDMEGYFWIFFVKRP